MKFIIINGSPKSENSVTLQSMKYLDKINKNYEFSYIHISKQIGSFEADKSAMEDVCNRIKAYDGVIWAFPVYCGQVPSDYKRFIELIFEYNLEECFNSKYTTAFSTSIHYYDHTAHNYIHSICDDLDMKYINYLSHAMDDLLIEERRKELSKFFYIFSTCIREKIEFKKEYKPLLKSNFKYEPNLGRKKLETDKRIFIITDAIEEDINVKHMIEKYKDCICGDLQVFNLNDIHIKGSCVGCCRCGYENICIYKDEFRDFLDNVIENADIIIYALTMKDRYLSSTYAKYVNRKFVYNHVPIYKGKQIGYMISGNIDEEKNSRQLIEEAGACIGIISDACSESSLLDKEIENFAKLTIIRSEQNYERKDNFLGIGGKKIFIDEIGNGLSGIFLADYKYYKENGYFQKKDIKYIKEKLSGFVFRYFMKKEKFRAEVHKNMYKHMVGAHEKIIEKII